MREIKNSEIPVGLTLSLGTLVSFHDSRYSGIGKIVGYHKSIGSRPYYYIIESDSIRPGSRSFNILPGALPFSTQTAIFVDSDIIEVINPLSQVKAFEGDIGKWDTSQIIDLMKLTGMDDEKPVTLIKRKKVKLIQVIDPMDGIIVRK